MMKIKNARGGEGAVAENTIESHLPKKTLPYHLLSAV
jgi:hypothetical protein